MAGESISDVLVMYPHRPMRVLLNMQLTESGYTAANTPTYTAVLRRLRRAAHPTVVLAGNWQADFRAELGFFGRIAADAALARRHRFVLFCTLPEWMPLTLDAILCGLGVEVLRAPCLPELLDAVALAAGRNLHGPRINRLRLLGQASGLELATTGHQAVSHSRARPWSIRSSPNVNSMPTL